MPIHERTLDISQAYLELFRELQTEKAQAAVQHEALRSATSLLEQRLAVIERSRRFWLGALTVVGGTLLTVLVGFLAKELFDVWLKSKMTPPLSLPYNRSQEPR